MKTVTQKDFQNLYKSPEYEQTEEMRRTLARLPEKKKTDWGTVFGKRRVAIILVAVLALLGVAGMAVSYFTGISVSWDAKPTEYVEPENHLTAEEYQSVFDLLNSYPKNEFVAAITKDFSNTIVNECNVSDDIATLEELKQILDKAGYPHPENFVPEGWTFSKANVYYSLSSEGRNELIEETESPDGKYTIKRYKIDEQHRIVTGYVVHFLKGEKLGVISSGYSRKDYILVSSIVYPADGDIQTEKLSIPGMEDALFLSFENKPCVRMYRPLENLVEVNEDSYGECLNGEYVETLDYEEIACDGFSTEEILQVFSETK